MELDNLQKKVAEFVKVHNIETSVENRLLDLVSEIGEVAKEALKGNNYGKSKFVKTEAWDEEIGDVLFAIICLANVTETCLERALLNVLKKYEERANISGALSSGK